MHMMRLKLRMLVIVHSLAPTRQRGSTGRRSSVASTTGCRSDRPVFPRGSVETRRAAVLGVRLWHWLPALALLLTLQSPALLADTLCAVVRIEIKQELTFERQAFEAHLRINNDLDTLAIEDLSVDVLFEDENGLPVTASFDPDNTDADFFIRIRSMQGTDAVDGSGSVAPSSSADVRWLIIPAPDSGGNNPNGTLYYVGARVGYTLGGEEKAAEVTPDYIFVKPLPLLSLDYFLERDVFADDPLTPEIESIEPFLLGLRVRNNGQGPATDVQIDSAQPEIVENELGLLIDFRITGSRVDEQPASPSLLVGLGDLDPGASRIAAWDMETTLSGQFVGFEAEFSHADELGGELTSLIDDVDTHFLIRHVRVDLPGRDAIRDFLAFDGDFETGIKQVFESNGIDSEVADLSDQASLTLLDNGREELSFTDSAGFVYVRLPDPYAGGKQVVEAFRTDGKVIRADNIWFSKTRNRDTDSWEYWLNLFDINSTGTYLLALENLVLPPTPPALQFITDKQIAEGGRLGFIVEASDPNGTLPTITADPLPDGAVLEDETSSQTLAQYALDWPVRIGQAIIEPDGTYSPYQITFTASDGVLETSQLVEILVCPVWDTDCDRMADAWEQARFGTLDRNGSGDFDNDGTSDLDEYLNGLSVIIAAQPGTNLIAYPHQVPPEHDTCVKLLNAIGATGPSDRLRRLDPTAQAYRTCTVTTTDSDPGHFGITTAEGYVLEVELPHELTLNGDPLCSAPMLAAGINLIGHPQPTAGFTCSSWLETLGSTTATSIHRLEPTTGRWQGCAYYGTQPNQRIAGYDFPILRGEGYLISSPVGGVLALPSCP